MANISSTPKDPEDYLTPEIVGNGTPKEWIDERLKGISGKHIYELCLFETYQQTKKYFKNNQTLEEYESVQHLYSIKSEIIRYALPNDIEWRQYVIKLHGNLIVKPLLNSDLYFRMMAFNLFLLDEREVGRFMDFQFVHAVLKPFPRKNTEESQSAKIKFLQQVNLWVIHLLDTQLSTRKKDVSDAVFHWIDNIIQSFTEEELVQFYDYEFSQARTFGMTEKVETALKPQYAGCNDETLRAYFSMLSTASTKDGMPLVSEKAIDYLLHVWFGVGQPVEFPEGEVVYVTIEEMAFFLKGFLYAFQIHKDPTRKSVTQKQLVNFLYQNLGEIFGNNEKETVYRRFSYFAGRGENPELDWKKQKHLKDLIASR